MYTWSNQYKHNLSTAREKTCYNLFAGCLQLVSSCGGWEDRSQQGQGFPH